MLSAGAAVARFLEIGVSRDFVNAPRRPGGDAVSRYGMGLSLVEAVPALLARATRAARTSPLFVLVPILSLAGCAWAAARTLGRLGAPPAAAAAAGTGLVLATPLWGYAGSDYGEPLQALCVALSVLAVVETARGSGLAPVADRPRRRGGLGDPDEDASRSRRRVRSFCARSPEDGEKEKKKEKKKISLKVIGPVGGLPSGPGGRSGGRPSSGRGVRPGRCGFAGSPRAAMAPASFIRRNSSSLALLRIRPASESWEAGTGERRSRTRSSRASSGSRSSRTRASSGMRRSRFSRFRVPPAPPPRRAARARARGVGPRAPLRVVGLVGVGRTGRVGPASRPAGAAVSRRPRGGRARARRPRVARPRALCAIAAGVAVNALGALMPFPALYALSSQVSPQPISESRAAGTPYEIDRAPDGVAARDGASPPLAHARVEPHPRPRSRPRGAAEGRVGRQPARNSTRRSARRCRRRPHPPCASPSRRSGSDGEESSLKVGGKTREGTKAGPILISTRCGIRWFGRSTRRTSPGRPCSEKS